MGDGGSMALEDGEEEEEGEEVSVDRASSSESAEKSSFPRLTGTHLEDLRVV